MWSGQLMTSMSGKARRRLRPGTHAGWEVAAEAQAATAIQPRHCEGVEGTLR